MQTGPTPHWRVLRQRPHSTFQTLSSGNMNREPPEEARLDELCLFPHTRLLLKCTLMCIQ